MKVNEIDIYQSALDNPIIRNAIKFFDSGLYSWTEAMMLAVKCLAEANKELSDKLIKERERRPPCVLIYKNKELQQQAWQTRVEVRKDGREGA